MGCLSSYLYGGYVGHYVTLYGVDDDGFFLYHAPAKTSHGGCKVSTENLRRARRARGTDEDLIFVSTDDALPAMAPFFAELGLEVGAGAEGGDSGGDGVAIAEGAAAGKADAPSKDLVTQYLERQREARSRE